MNKLGLVAAVVVVGAVAAAPLVSGMMIEKRFRDYQIPASAPAGLTWHLDSYQRGYLHATALSTLSYSSPLLEDQPPVRIQIRQEIDQVPSLTGRLASVQTTWVPAPEIKAQLAKVLGDKEPIVLDTTMSWAGVTHTTGTIAGFSLPDAQFSGGTLTLDTARSGAFDFSMVMDSLAATDPESASGEVPIVLKGLKLGGTGVMSPEGIAWDSQFHAGIDSLASQAGHVGGLLLTGKSAKVGEVFNASVGIDIKTLDVADLPPAAKGMRDLKLHYQLDGLDAKALEAITQQLREAQKSGGDPEQIKQVATMALMTHLPDLLNHGVSFQLNPIGFDTDAGPVAFNLQINLPSGQGQALLSNPMGLLNTLTVKGDYRAPQALMNAMLDESDPSAENQLSLLIQEGYLNANQGVLSTQFAFEQGKLTINGKPADDLLGAVGGLAR
ncbi:DUF945 family protein [Halothiobacillus sp. DCM-1]|uniref:DUF945 family protein n=1 Tax=Halothiobacillus sp. DCM-1 TaxID=3112558 RepID=UPI00324357C5